MQVMYKLLVGVLMSSRMMSVSSQAIKNKMQLQIEDILRKASFSPTHVEVINESFDHTGIKQSDEPELASHLRIIVVSPQFEKKALLQCHRLVQEELTKNSIYDQVHAIQIITKTPEAWEKSQTVPDAPKCQGGDGRPKKQGVKK